MLELLQQLFTDYFNVTIDSGATLTAIVIFLIAILVIIVLRIVVYLAYQIEYSVFKLCAKDIKTMKDIKETKCRLLNKATKDYMRSAERGVDNIDTSTIVTLHINKLGFLIFNWKAIERFVVSMETSIMLVGIGLALFLEVPEVFAILAIGSFILIRLIAIFTDFVLIRDRILTEMTIYIEQEIGQYYSTRIPTVIHMLKAEMKNIITEQSNSVGKYIEKLGTDVAAVLQLSMQEMTKTIDTTMQNVMRVEDVFKEPLEAFKQTVIESSELQKSINTSFENIASVTKDFDQIIITLGKTFAEQNDYLVQHSESIYVQIDELKKVTGQLIDNNINSERSVKDIEQLIKYVEENQIVLKNSLNAYEVALEQITSKIGDGLGSIIGYQTESAYNKFNDSIQNNINVLAKTNNDVVKKLKILFDQLYEQSKNETQAIVRIYEQMDMHFGKRNE